MFRCAAATNFLILAISPCLAVEAPSLPSSAKKLTGKEIAALYDGATVAFNNFTMAQPLTGTVTYDLKSHKHHGTYKLGEQGGQFTGALRIKGDQFCHAEGNSKERCVSVYTDNSDIYEVNSKGVVESKKSETIVELRASTFYGLNGMGRALRVLR
jgi:hypothetical protein